MSCGKPLKHAQEKVKPITSNFNIFPFEKEGIVSFYKDPFNSIDCKNEVLKLLTYEQID